MPSERSAGLRLDKWLWAARFFKTRSLATAAINAGRVRLNGGTVKPAREVRIGDTVILQKAGDVIPDIVSVVKELRTSKEKKFVWPTRVAACGESGKIERIPGASAWCCVNKNSFITN